MRTANRLKAVRRQGWIDRGVPAPESSADHSWSLALFVWLVAQTRGDLNAGRVLLLALIHDLPEALAGDATPFDRHRREDGTIPADHFRAAPTYAERETKDKHARERRALADMIGGLPDELSEKIRSAWDEYMEGLTAEARFVRQMDKLETLLQAEIYLDQHSEIVIDSFRAGTERDVTDPGLRRMLAALTTIEEREDDQQ